MRAWETMSELADVVAAWALLNALFVVCSLLAGGRRKRLVRVAPSAQQLNSESLRSCDSAQKTAVTIKS
jgi:hypothetical protein